MSRTHVFFTRAHYGALILESEEALFQKLVRSLRPKYLSRMNKLDRTMVLLRIEDLVTAFFSARRAEDSLRDGSAYQEAAGTKPASGDGKAAKVSLTSVLEAAAKARERYRKSLSEFEEAARRLLEPVAATPEERGVALRIKHLSKEDLKLAECDEGELRAAS